MSEHLVRWAALIRSTQPRFHDAIVDEAIERECHRGHGRCVHRNTRNTVELDRGIGGNLLSEVLFATALGIFARSLGYDIALSELLVINISVSLLASFIPVPGGIGVVEFGLTAGLVAAGMTEEAAFAAVILYRLSTFYLPPAWGFFAMRWLQRNRYL